MTEGTEISTLARFLEAGLAVDARNYEDETLLMVATSIGWLEAARLLVEKGADVWARNGYGDTALHLASHVKMCRYLVEECGADVNACNRDGYTPLFLNVVGHVCSCCSEALVGALLRLGADPNLGTLEGEKPLREVGRLRRGVYRRNGDAAARKVSRRVEKLLVRYGAVV